MGMDKSDTKTIPADSAPVGREKDKNKTAKRHAFIAAFFLGVISSGYGYYRYIIMPQARGRDLAHAPVVLDNNSALTQESPDLARLLHQEIAASFTNQPVLIICRDAYAPGEEGWQAIARDMPEDWSRLAYFSDVNGLASRIETLDVQQRSYENYLGGTRTTETASFEMSPQDFRRRYPNRTPPVVIWLEGVFPSDGQMGGTGAYTIYHEFAHGLADLHGIALQDDEIEPHAIVYEILRGLQLAAQRHGQAGAGFEEAIRAAQLRRRSCAIAEWKSRTLLHNDSERSYYCDAPLAALLQDNAALARETISVHIAAPPSEMAHIAANLVKEHLGDMGALRRDLAAMAPLQQAIHDRATKFENYELVLTVSLARVLTGQEEWTITPNERQRAYIQGVFDAIAGFLFKDSATGQKYQEYLEYFARTPLGIERMSPPPKTQDPIHEAVRMRQEFSNGGR